MAPRHAGTRKSNAGWLRHALPGMAEEGAVGAVVRAKGYEEGKHVRCHVYASCFVLSAAGRLYACFLCVYVIFIINGVSMYLSGGGRGRDLKWVSSLGVGAPFSDRDLKWVSSLGVGAPFSDRLQFSELSVGSSPC